MTSTEFNIGMSSERSSSRVLKPPGGGHTNLFGGEAEVHVPSPRPKYDQQNSSNLNFCMNTVDPNILVEQQKPGAAKAEPSKPAAADPAPKASAPSQPSTNGNNGSAAAPAPAPAPAQASGRVPPGGFSSGGFW